MARFHTASALAVVCTTACGSPYGPQRPMMPASGFEPTPVESQIGASPPGAEPGSSRPRDTTSREAAVRSIVEERCVYRSHCGQIGDGRRFSSWDTCLEGEDLSVRGHMSTCFHGIAEPRLKTCLEDILLFDCHGTSDTVADVQSCDIDRVCRR